MKHLKFKHWWRETIITDEKRRGLSRGSVILTLANKDGVVHFSADVDEIYDDLARANGMGLWSQHQGSWRDFGLAPIQAIVRQVAHEMLLGMEDWIRPRRPDWVYDPKLPKATGHAFAPGIVLRFSDDPPVDPKTS